MAYTIVKSDGTVLTTIADGTINTTSTSLGLPGRNYAGYGQYLDTNFVHAIENFAKSTPPANPLKGQLWFDTNVNVLKVCPADGTTNALAWLSLASTGSSGTTTFGNVTITGNLIANNGTFLGQLSADSITTRLLTVTANATIANANVTNANLGNLYTNLISTGSNTTAGSLIGTWTANGGAGGNAFIVTNGNLVASGIKTDNYYYSNGVPFIPPTTYTNGNVYDYLTGSNSVAQFTGNIAPTKVTTSYVAGGIVSATGNGTFGNVIASLHVGNLSGVGNSNVGNLGGNNAIFTTFTGNGSGITFIAGSSVNGAVASATTAGTVTTNAQPNITSTGTLTSLNVGGALSASSLSVSGTTNLGAVTNITITGGVPNAILQTNGIGGLSWTTLTTATTITNGTSNVAIPVAGGNVNTSVAGNANVFVVTGTGANVGGYLSASGNVSDSKGDVRTLVLNSQGSPYTLIASDAGKTITTTANVTVPNAIFSGGQVVTVYNNSGSTINIVQGGSVTLQLAGSATTGNRTLAQRGLCTILCVAANTFVVSGAGIA